MGPGRERARAVHPCAVAPADAPATVRGTPGRGCAKRPQPYDQQGRGFARPITGNPPDVLILKPPGVYATQEDTGLLVESLRGERLGPDTKVLDMGTGTGALAMAAARAGAGSVTAVDASAR
ncbi:50S ribosomal protein L11 methyltransferase, partial [Streptomyces sparsus]